MSKAQALNRPTTCGAEIDRRARRDEQPPCQTSKKHQSGNARRVSIRARRVDSCAPCRCVRAECRCVRAECRFVRAECRFVRAECRFVRAVCRCVRAVCRFVLEILVQDHGQAAFWDLSPQSTGANRSTPSASTAANRSTPPGLNWSESLQRRASSCRFVRARIDTGRDESAARASPRPQPLSQTKNRNPFMSTATITSTDTGQKSPRQTTTQPTTTPTRTLRRQQAPHHHVRRETRVHVAGRSKDARPGAAHDGSPSVDDGDATAGRGLTAPENTKGRQARDGDLLPSRWNHVG